MSISMVPAPPSVEDTEKDRQRYALYLTVFWFWLACISKKTVRNTVNLPDYPAQICSTPYLFPLSFNQL
jgi:hypothetical protein